MEKQKLFPISERKFWDRVKFAISHWGKRWAQRIAISNYKNMHKEDYIVRSDYEKEAVKICRNLITKNKDSDLRIAPQSGKRHIKNLPLNIRIFIYETSIDIIKNNFPQNVPISPKARKTIINMFDGYAEKYRNIEEDEVHSNLKHSLESILEETTPTSYVLKETTPTPYVDQEVADINRFLSIGENLKKDNELAILKHL